MFVKWMGGAADLIDDCLYSLNVNETVRNTVSAISNEASDSVEHCVARRPRIDWHLN